MQKTNIVSRSLFLLLSLLFVAYAANPVAIVIKSRGKVNLFRGKTLRAETIRKGRVLYDGNKIQTTEGSFCAIKFIDDKSLLRIKENSTCVIEGKREKDHINKNVIVEVGSFFASLFKQKGRFTVTTPTSVASVKGTKFWIIQLATGKTVYIGIEGLIDLINEAGRVLLRSGQTATFTSSDKLPDITLTDESDIPQTGDDTNLEKSLEIEFQDNNGQTKKLRIDYIEH